MSEPNRAFVMPRRMSGESMLGPGQRYLWLCIPKNASRSISTMLAAAGASRVMEMYAGQLTRGWAEAHLEPAFVFAFVRNPYDRILSVWRNKVAEPAPTEGGRGFYGKHPGLQPGMGFDEFIDWLGEAYPRGDIDKHWAVQSDFLHDGTRLIPDFVGTTEALEAGLQSLREIVGPLGSMRRKNVSGASDGLSSTAISAPSRQIIRRLYREDFERFGYEA